MRVKQKILAIKLSERIKKHSEYVAALGVEINLKKIENYVNGKRKDSKL